ncbi:hypothetical protein AVT10_17395 [Sphingomonas hankookensis]|uniref:Uncharacterized protein n=1 Tax=Sphingomonas hankookensis TaxID=563996 RepID=A0ABR5YAJ3_9SPHN|nr:hypothetical protein AVT10_17395 [Sphingomonas hankookensis]
MIRAYPLDMDTALDCFSQPGSGGIRITRRTTTTFAAMSRQFGGINTGQPDSLIATTDRVAIGSITARYPVDMGSYAIRRQHYRTGTNNTPNHASASQ